MNLIKNILPKHIISKFQNFNYDNFINTNEDKLQSSITNDYSYKFIENNKNFEKNFVYKMKLFWICWFLGIFAILAILSGMITIIIIFRKDGFWAIIPGLLLVGAVLIGYNFIFLPKMILNKITDRVENFKIFETLFNEGQFKNFDEKTGPYEFQTILLLKGSGNFIKLGSTGALNRFRDDSPNIISCMYICTKMLLYYFENSNKSISNKEGK